MKKKRSVILGSMIVASLLLVMGCGPESELNDDERGGDGETTAVAITIASIPGVSAPTATETPVTAIPETDQYTGIISWSPADASFEYQREYTAIITLTPQSGYTLTGVPADFFTVEGANSVSNDADTGVITAQFPATAAYTIDISAIPGVTPPAGGEVPATEIAETDQYTGIISWSPGDAYFEYEREYIATITLTPQSGYTLTGVPADFFTVEGASSISNDADTGVVTAVFPETAAYTIDISAIAGVTPPVAGGIPVTEISETDQYIGTISWSPADASFEYQTEYTATITLTPKSGYTLIGVPADFFTVEGANSVSNDADSGVVTAVFPETLEYAIGDTGPAGGLIFYIDEAGNYDWTYLEAAPSGWGGGTNDPQTSWQATSTASNQFEAIGSEAQGTSIGTGETNTAAIISWLTMKGQNGHAAQLANDCVVDGYDDWFLPSHDELNAMYLNLHDQGLGGFLSTYYWSSSEVQASYARNQDFYNGNRNPPYVDGRKSLFKHIRPIRAF